MSLSSLLLGSSKSAHTTIDEGLDDLFKSSATTSAGALASHKPASHVLPEPSSTPGIKKRKKKEDPVIATETDSYIGSRRSNKKPKLGSHEGDDVCSTPVARHKAGKKQGDLSKMNPSMIGSEMVGSGIVGRGPRDELIGTHVMVIKGPSKGVAGVIKDTNGNLARVGLLTGNKVISIDMSKLKRRKLDGTLEDLDRSMGGDMRPPSVNPHMAPRTPSWMTQETKGDQNPVSEVAKAGKKAEEKRAGKDRKGKGKQAPAPAVSEDESQDEDEAVKAGVQDSSSSDSEVDDNEYVPPVHESLAGGSRSDSACSSKKGRKYVPPDESPDQRDSRTIFVGNVPPQVMGSKSLLKQFKRHILSPVPTAKIESVRFRSIPFQKPTAKLPSETDYTSSHPEPTKRPVKDKESLRQHDVDRISSWRTSKDAPTGDLEKKYLTPQEKKRVAFIKQDFHERGDSVNAYIVFAHPPPKEIDKRPKAMDIMDPYQAAKVVVEKCDRTIFEEKTLRVDSVRKRSAEDASGEGVGDPKLSIFVGNLDFASKEEDLRVFFETLVTAERGTRPQAEDSEDENGTRSSRWVARVRIVKDKDTQLGKGFAYVQFADRECVDEILALEQAKIKFAKRKLRVQRCKPVTSTSRPVKKATEKGISSSSPHKNRTVTGGTITNPHPSGSSSTRLSTPRSIPKGDPALGKKLEHLSKDERKREKAANADRVARRLAKKQVKVAMSKGKLKFGGDGKGKERVRVRKGSVVSGAPSSGKAKAKKSRIRSEASLAKRNVKK